MIMKRDIKTMLYFFIALGLLYGCASGPKMNAVNFGQLVSFDELKGGEKLPIQAAIYLPEGQTAKLSSLSGDDPDLWPWFFKEALDTIFQKTIEIKNIEEVNSLPDVKTIVKPEIWGYYFQPYFTGIWPSLWTTWLDFRFSFFDRKGDEIISIPTEGNCEAADAFNALAQCMNNIIEELQKEVLLSSKEELMSSL